MKKHPLNVSYLVVGLVFLGLSGSWALRESGVIDLGDTRWLLPATLVLAGVVGLVAFVGKGVPRRTRSGQDDAGDTYDPGYDYGTSYDYDYEEKNR